MTAPKLLPCPFCGEDAIYILDHTTECNHSCGCDKCGIQFDTFNSDTPISAWNRRADASPALGAAAMKRAVLDGQLRALERASDGMPLARCMDLPDDLPSHADLLAEAKRLPEVAALVDALEKISTGRARTIIPWNHEAAADEYSRLLYDFRWLARAALAALEAKP